MSFYWNNVQIDRPPIKVALNKISQSNITKVYTTESNVFNHYLANYKISLKKNLQFDQINTKNIQSFPKRFWFLCMNNARFKTVKKNLPDEKKCFTLNKRNDLSLIKTLKMPDLIIHLFEQK